MATPRIGLLGPLLEEIEGVLAIGSDGAAALLPVGGTSLALVGRRELSRLSGLQGLGLCVLQTLYTVHTQLR